MLKNILTKIGELYNWVFKTPIRFVGFFVSYFVAITILPKQITDILIWFVLAFIILGIVGKRIK